MAKVNTNNTNNNKVLECSFSLLNEGRKYSGQHRKYIINNAREVCYAPETRERIKLREALGYYGHGRRILCQKMNLQEVDVITLPDGTQAMVSNIPSNVTVSFDVDEDGTVRHKQEILDTETGKIVASLNASKVGGFSWACPAEDGGSTKATHLTGFSGFDYVLQPGFSNNRGYVLENARNMEQMILESVAAVVKDDKRAAQMVAGWKLADKSTYDQLENAIFESESKLFAMQDENKQLKEFYTQAVNDRDAARSEAQHVKDNFKYVLESIQKAMPFVVPESVMHAMLEGDFDRAKVIFENAGRIDYSQYPLFDDGGNFLARTNLTVPNPLFTQKKHEEETFGTAQYGFDLDL